MARVKSMQVYLDNSATTKPGLKAVAMIREAMEEGFFNPSSLYKPALDAQKRVEACREAIAPGKRVIFTASGTEADNLAIIGRALTVKKPGRVLYLAVEHPAVKEACLSLSRMGHTAQKLPVDGEGVIDLARLKDALSDDVFLICVMQVNNETGAIQPIEAVAKLRDQLAPLAAIHVDGVQGYLRIPFEMDKWGVQSYAISGHKIHGPKGIGALITQNNHRLAPILFGGGQEKGLRSGTENTPGIAGLYGAVLDYDKEAGPRMFALKKRLFDALGAAIPTVRLNGPSFASPFCAPHILNVSLAPVRSDTMLFALEGSGVYVSSGSACASSKQKVSESLLAMAVARNEAECAIRFSLSRDTTEKEIDYAAEEVIKHYRLLSKYVRR